MTLFGDKAVIAAFLVLSVSVGSVAAAGQAPQSQPSELQIQSSIPVQSPSQGTILSNPGEVTLYWTAPGDDGNIGTADHYVVKYSSSLITDSNWGSVTTVPNPPAPFPAGSHQAFTFSGLDRGTPYYFAIKTYDEVGNVSGLSNVIRKFTAGIMAPLPGSAVIDSINGIATLYADTVMAAQRLIYQFAVDTAAAFSSPAVAYDSLVHSPVSAVFSNLQHDQTYYWRVRAIFQDRTDTSLWSSTSTFYMPGIPPALSNITATHITVSSAAIGWDSDEPATSQVDYGTSNSYGLSTIMDTSLVTGHSQILSNLEPSTTYHYRVRSSDRAGNEAVSGDFTFTTEALPPPPPDSLQLLSIGAAVTVSATYPGYSQVAINDGVIAPYGRTATTWASNQDAAVPHWVEMVFDTPKTIRRVRIYWAWNFYLSSWMCSRQYSIEYWDSSTGSYQEAVIVNNSARDSVTTTDFGPVTTTRIRYWQPANMGPNGYGAILWLTEFEVYGNGSDNTAPTLSNITASDITVSSATIDWDSDEPATSQVDYGTSNSYGLSSALDTSLVTGHSQILSNLEPSTTYHYRVRSSDRAGNEAVSGDFTFTTEALPPPPPDSLQLLSIGAAVTVSATYPGYSQVAINDGVIAPYGRTATTWASDQDATVPHWVEMTFDTPKTIRRVRIYWAWNFYLSSWMCSRQYSIEYWDGGTGSYQQAAIVNNSAQDSVTTTDFGPVTTTRIRYWQPANMGPNGYGAILWLTELEIYGMDAPGILSLDGANSQNPDANGLLLSRPGGSFGSIVPADYFLSQSYPNPFNAVTKIDYGLPEGAYISFDIFDITGRHVATLVNGYQEAGYHSLTWDSSSEPSGIYLYRLKAGGFVQTKKMTVLK